jgi:hypothetical protein
MYSNDERYYIYFFVLAGLQLVFILIFIGCDRQFKLLKLTNQHFDSHLFISSNSESTNA